jgi:ABC-type Zn uptake system ZnuABC Zn-binding protein ZnuA
MGDPRIKLLPANAVRAGLLLLFCIAFGCDAGEKADPDNSSSSSPQKLKTVATISIIGDWVKIVGGNDVELKTLVGPDGDPHEYEPLPQDDITLLKANVIFENGFGLETWLDRIYSSSDSRATRVVLTQGIDLRHIPATETQNADADDRDPHAWQNVKNASVMVRNIRDALEKADAPHAAAYAARAGAYLRELSDLDAWVQAEIDSLPPARRKLVTSHDAFGYFGDRYGVDISRSALESVSTETSDPSARQLAEVVSQIKASGVPVIFVENVQNPELINQIAEEAGVNVGPPLYTDALGKPGSPGETYVKMMRYNVTTMVKALSQ